MEYFGNILCLTYGELTSGDDPVMSLQCYRSLQRRGAINVVRSGKGLGNSALVEYSSMPERFKERVLAKYGNPEKIMSRANEPLAWDNEAFIYFDRREVGGKVLSDRLRDQYYLNASVLNRLVKNLHNQQMGRHACGNRTKINWDGIYAENERLREIYGHTLPGSKRLQETVNRYIKEGYPSLLSKKIGNANRTKLAAGTPQGDWVIAQKRCRYPYKSFQDILEEYNATAPSKGWKRIESVQTIVNFLEDPSVKHRWADTVQGELALRQLVQYQHDTQLPMVRDMLWFGDATKLNLYYKAFVNGSYKPATLMVYEVIDACSEVLLGCAIGKDENFELMYTAYRNALEFAGHKPYENVTDGQGGTRRDDAQWFLHNAASVFRYAQPYHGNSKTIENIFGRLQSQVLRKYDNYTGGNITTRSSRSKVDIEYLEANVNNLPTFDELVAQYMSCRDDWNNMPHPNQKQFPGMTRMQVYQSTTNDAYAPALTEEMKQNIWMIPLRKEIKATAAGIKFEINGKEYAYTVKQADGIKPDLIWMRDNIDRQFEVHVDPWTVGQEDSVIRLYTVRKTSDRKKERIYVTDATVKTVIPRAQAEQTEDVRKYIREVERDVQDLRVRMSIEHHAMDMEYGIAPEQHGRVTPQIKGLNKRYEQIADKIVRTGQARVVPSGVEPQPAEVYPETVGERQKKESFADRM